MLREVEKRVDLIYVDERISEIVLEGIHWVRQKNGRYKCKYFKRKRCSIYKKRPNLCRKWNCEDKKKLNCKDCKDNCCEEALLTWSGKHLSIGVRGMPKAI